eukprot:CAMPEP_0181116428 /NCGR_PEP_ID=MMETSP1071-20121207/21945_1 /TAXON_ID=35127 /ORGANISM="Thalassiosira sp., Strain NH16" /LENGTH=209 /DNA_ID=CAMNT_0023200671 /DNA_START=91 /DNA_END=720 /DNA_ORIENTATION=-
MKSSSTQRKSYHRREPRRVMKKRVCFSESSELFIVPNNKIPHDNTIEARNSMWYSRSEIRSLKANKIRAVVNARRIGLIKQGRDEAAVEILGLERYLSSYITREHKRRKRELATAVNLEQRCQSLTRTSPDPERLADVARCHTRWAMGRARMAALLLQRDCMLDDDDAKDIRRRAAVTSVVGSHSACKKETLGDGSFGYRYRRPSCCAV